MSDDRAPAEPSLLIEVVVSPDDAGQRADVILGREVAGLSRRVARRLALEGRLLADGERVPPSHRARAGERLTLRPPTPRDELPRLEVLAVTDHFVYVHKPSGVHTHPLRPGEQRCVSVAVARAHPECAAASADADPREGGAVHRLDRDTSGVLAFARHPEAYARARSAFTGGEVHKDYVARVHPGATWPPPEPPGALPGWVTPASPLPRLPGLEPVGPALEIRAPLGRGEQRGAMAVRLDGQRATTVVAPIRASGVTAGPPPQLQLQLLHLQLLTGRRHQARVHLAWVGLPILGDGLYGPPTDGAPTRLHLHALRLDLGAVYPDEAPVQAALPDEFLAVPAAEPTR